MPVGTVKNLLYGLALPVLGQRPAWRAPRGATEADAVARALWRKRCVGACVQRFEGGSLTECICAGHAALEPAKRPGRAGYGVPHGVGGQDGHGALVFRCKPQGRERDRGNQQLWGRRICNPHCPDAPITLGHAAQPHLQHCGFAHVLCAFQSNSPLSELLSDPRSYLPAVPGTVFRYSNLAAGMVASLLEKRFDMSFEQLMQQELLEPLGVAGTFDPSGLDVETVADSYRVLTPARAFCAAKLYCFVRTDEGAGSRATLPAARETCSSPRPDLARLALVAWGGGVAFWMRKAWRRCAAPWRAGPKRP